MRAALLPIFLISMGSPCGAGEAFGVWKLNPTRSSTPFSDLVAVRFEPHRKGEVFTVERVAANGRATTSSTILYFDTQPRDFQDSDCSGTQSSRHLDDTTAEIVRACAGGRIIHIVRRSGETSRELVMEISEQRTDGRHFDRRLVFEKQ